MPLFPESEVLEKLDYWCKTRKYSLNRLELDVTNQCMLRSIKYGAVGALGSIAGVVGFTRVFSPATKGTTVSMGAFGTAMLAWELGKSLSQRPSLRAMLSVEDSVVAQVTREIMRASDLDSGSGHFHKHFARELENTDTAAMRAHEQMNPEGAAEGK